MREICLAHRAVELGRDRLKREGRRRHPLLQASRLVGAGVDDRRIVAVEHQALSVGAAGAVRFRTTRRAGLGGFEHTPVVGSHGPTSWHSSRAVHVTVLVPVQVPPGKCPLCVQAFLSSQGVPLAAAGFEQVPVAGLHVPAAWHWSAAVHVTGFAADAGPAWQASPCVHALPSLQAVSVRRVGFEHVPVAGLHVPDGVALILAVHVTRDPPVQRPTGRCRSACRRCRRCRSSRLRCVGFEHVPVRGLHVPAAWH